MSLTLFLDAGPLGVLTNPKHPIETINMIRWTRKMEAAGHFFIVPAIADFEVRRELERGCKINGLAALDAWENAVLGRYLPLSDEALRLASKLWAQARNSGRPTDDSNDLGADVLIAAQAIMFGVPRADFIVVTTNAKHLAQFVPCDLWTNIRP